MSRSRSRPTPRARQVHPHEPCRHPARARHRERGQGQRDQLAGRPQAHRTLRQQGLRLRDRHRGPGRILGSRARGPLRQDHQARRRGTRQAPGGEFLRVPPGDHNRRPVALIAGANRLLGIGIGTGGLIDKKRGMITLLHPARHHQGPRFPSRIIASQARRALLRRERRELLRLGRARLQPERGAPRISSSPSSSSARTPSAGTATAASAWASASSSAARSTRAPTATPASSARPSATAAAISSSPCPRTHPPRWTRTPRPWPDAADELARNMAMLVNTMDFDQGLRRRRHRGPRRRLSRACSGAASRRTGCTPPQGRARSATRASGDRAVAYGAAGMVLDRLVSERLLPGLGRPSAGAAPGGAPGLRSCPVTRHWRAPGPLDESSFTGGIGMKQKEDYWSLASRGHGRGPRARRLREEARG